jgi:hypothetical protein
MYDGGRKRGSREEEGVYVRRNIGFACGVIQKEAVAVAYQPTEAAGWSRISGALQRNRKP